MKIKDIIITYADGQVKSLRAITDEGELKFVKLAADVALAKKQVEDTNKKLTIDELINEINKRL